MLDLDTPIFYLPVHLAIAFGVVGVLVLLSNQLRFRPWIGLLTVLVVSGALLAGWTAWVTRATMMEIRREHVSFLDHQSVENYRHLGPRAAIFGATVGLMAYAGTLLWKGNKRSRLGLLLILLSWVVLGLGLTAETLLFIVAMLG